MQTYTIRVHSQDIQCISIPCMSIQDVAIHQVSVSCVSNHAFGPECGLLSVSSLHWDERWLIKTTFRSLWLHAADYLNIDKGDTFSVFVDYTD